MKNETLFDMLLMLSVRLEALEASLDEQQRARYLRELDRQKALHLDHLGRLGDEELTRLRALLNA